MDKKCQLISIFLGGVLISCDGQKFCDSGKIANFQKVDPFEAPVGYSEVFSSNVASESKRNAVFSYSEILPTGTVRRVAHLRYGPKYPEIFIKYWILPNGGSGVTVFSRMEPQKLSGEELGP